MVRNLILTATFLSAFLLFVVQPLYAKYLLPYFGGTSSVWTISVFFYSVTLLFGYIYAGLLLEWKSKTAWVIHSVLLVLAGAILVSRTMAGESGLLVSATASAEPAFSVLLTLAMGLGLPVLLLASTSVLAQHLYSKLTSQEPYHLYALSNAGSLAGLAAYPLVFELFTDLSSQASWWVSFFVIYLVLLIIAWRLVDRDNGSKQTGIEFVSRRQAIFSRRKIVLMSAIPTFLLVALTEFLSIGIASFPLLWVIPLMVYLVSFIVTFGHGETKPRIIPFGFWTLVSLILVFAVLPYMNSSPSIYWLSLPVVLVMYFLVSVYFHRRVYDLRPKTEDLGPFYVWLTFGGALGSGVVGLVLPVITNRADELYLAIGILAVYFAYKYLGWLGRYVNNSFVWVTKSMVLILAFSFIFTLTKQNSPVAENRNFYGTPSVLDLKREVYGESIITRVLVNGYTNHGLQALDDRYEEKAASYYGVNSGIDVSLRNFIDRDESPRVAVVGLGVGMISSYCDDLRRLDYIEINPAVETIAREHFTYLDRCRDKTTVTIADGRLALEETAEKGGIKYDVIMMDAFTDDAIPVHLLTREAFQRAYLPLLDEHGIIAFHVSNKYLNLFPPIVGTARELGYEALAVVNPAQPDNELHQATRWVLVTKKENTSRLLSYPSVSTYSGKEIIWTDERSSIVNVLSVGGR